MNEPQIWTALGILAAAFASMVVIVTQLLTRTISAQFQTLGEKIDKVDLRLSEKIDKVDLTLGEKIERVDLTLGEKIERVDLTLGEKIDKVDLKFTEKINGLDERFKTIDERFKAIDARFETIDTRFDATLAVVGSLRTEVISRLDRLESQYENLDRDVQAISRKVFPE